MEKLPFDNIPDQPEEIVLSPEILKNIEDLERIKYLSPRFKGYIILVYAGIKPATIFQMNNRSGKKESNFEQEIEKLQSVLDTFRLSYAVQSSDRERKIVSFFVAKDKETRDEFLAAYDGKLRSPERDERLGTVLGFPPTAVEAFSHNEENIIREKDLPQDVRDSEEFVFKHFVLSKNNWQEEFEVVKKMAATVKAYAPNLYNTIINESRSKK
ncbi:MAG: hypothetical protein K0S38_793 [Candidatus Paceibacter sp.]|jgi:hypothetical protein|nr:hypothetical protein [Candidatus Paceibacter sp.]